MKRLFAFILVIVILLSFMIPVNIISAAAEEPEPEPTPTPDFTFPYDVTYLYGMGSQADDQEAAAKMLQTEWNEWKSQRITTSGAGAFKRVQRDGSTNYDTVSEGIAYGMLLSVYFDDRALFDDLYNYAKLHFNGNGLMGWHVDPEGNFTTTDGGSGAATDADEDMAVSLLFAFKKWGNAGAINYEEEAKKLINAIMTYEVDAKTYVLKPGDTWGGPSVTNPSYFAPAWYRIFYNYTQDVRWSFVISKCFEIIYNCRNYNDLTGLLPDWCKSSGLAAENQSYDFKYDAIRIPWRLAVDYSWNRGTDPKNISDQISKFFAKSGVAAIGDGYTIKGKKISDNHSPAFIACLSAGAMTFTGYDAAYVKELYEESIKVKNPVPADPKSDYSYYGNTLRLLTLLYTTGNFPNFYQYTAASPTLKPIETPVPPSANISGYIDADFTYESSSAELIKSGFKVEISSLGKSAITDTKGYFNMMNVPKGVYTLKISKNNYLVREISGVTVNSDVTISSQAAPIKLWAGDIIVDGAQDGSINMSDIIAVANYFNTGRGDGKYISGYDLNVDNSINMSDIIIIASHFNKVSGDYK